MKNLVLLLAAVLLHPAVRSQDLQELMQQASERATRDGAPKLTFAEHGDPIPLLDFTGSMRMEMRMWRNGTEEKDSPASIVMAFTPEKMMMAPKAAGKEQVRMLFDLPNKHTYTLMDDGKGGRTALKMKMMKVNVEGGAAASEDDAVSVERTSETRSIGGHLCRKIIYTSAEGRGEAWIAEDVPFDLMDAFSRMTSGRTMQAWQRVHEKGLVMESDWTSSDGQERTTMTIHDLVLGSVAPALLSIDGYEVQDMTSMPMMGR